MKNQIFLVDDDKAARGMLKDFIIHFLNKKGKKFEFLEFNSTTEACNYFLHIKQEDAPLMIITDKNCPEPGSGIGLCGVMLDDVKFKNTEIVLTSADLAKIDLAFAKVNNIFTLAKPIDLAKVKEMLDLIS